MVERNSTEWRDWLEYAKNDRELGNTLVESSNPCAARGIAQAAHQMAEHSLEAAYLFFAHKMPPKTHDLAGLARFVQRKKALFTKEEMLFPGVLHKYFMPLKYPQSVASLPTYEKAKELFNRASSLLARIEAELGGGAGT